MFKNLRNLKQSLKILRSICNLFSFITLLNEVPAAPKIFSSGPAPRRTNFLLLQYIVFVFKNAPLRVIMQSCKHADHKLLFNLIKNKKKM